MATSFEDTNKESANSVNKTSIVIVYNEIKMSFENCKSGKDSGVCGGCGSQKK